jgi:signal transduction histidine kinase
MMVNPWSSLRFRLIAAALVGLVLGLLVMAALLISVYRESVRRAFDLRLQGLAHILVASAEINPDGHLVIEGDIGEPLFERVYSGWYWQVSSAVTPEQAIAEVRRSRSLFDFALPVAQSDTGNKETTVGPLGERLRIVRLRVTLPGSATPYNVVVAGDYDVVSGQIAAYVGTLLLALAIMALIFVGVFWAQVRFALSPMLRVRHALAAVRDGQAEKLEGRFPSEVEPLVTELNSLLEHNKEVVERARTQVGNLAHALKTPLSVLRIEIEGGGDQLALVASRETQTMRRQIDHYLTRARAAAAANVLGVRTDISARAAALVRTMAKLYRDRNVDFDLDCTPGLAFRGEAQDLDEILGNLLDNGGKWAKARVLLRAQPAANRQVLITVEDDGPGLGEHERAAVVARGQRLDESVPGTGLGLSIVNDLVLLYGGKLTLESSALGGLRVSLLLPAATVRED